MDGLLWCCVRTLPHRIRAEYTDGDASRRVRAVMLFIASIGQEADEMVERLPRGHAFVCLEMARLPQAMREIFTSTNPSV